MNGDPQGASGPKESVEAIAREAIREAEVVMQWPLYTNQIGPIVKEFSAALTREREGREQAERNSRSAQITIAALTEADTKLRAARHAAEARVAALEKALLGLRSNVEAWRTGALDDTEALDRLCIIAANMPDPRMEANVQNGTSLAVNLFGHRWGKPYADGYATCPCGARENTPEAARQCPQSTGAALAETTEPPTP